MKFRNLKVKDLIIALKHTPTIKQWQANDRPTHIIGIQLRGNMYHEMADRNITLTENCLFFFNQKDDFTAVVKELGESYTIHFTTWEPIETETFVVRTTNPGEAISLLESVEKALSLRAASENLAMSDFYRFCYLLQKLRSQKYHPKDPRMTGARDYINLHFRERTVLADAATDSGLSRRRFNDLFKQQFGITPNTYLIDLRIDAAKALLMDHSLSIINVAERCGFEDNYYFCKVFKNQTSLTPTQFRKGNNKKEH